MSDARIGAALASLNNGLILIAGGFGINLGALTSISLYNPNSTFSTTSASMVQGRYLATATSLPGGNVLIAGGVGAHGTALSSAEIYNATTGSFRLTSNTMSDSRYGATATLLPNGEVLIAGGLDAANQFQASADLYNPVSDSFTASASTMSERRQYATATLLPSGEVLIAGGFGLSAPSFYRAFADADLYDPATDTFTASTSQMNNTRYGATATLLNSGKVLIAGGINAVSSSSLKTAALYDPATDSFIASEGTLSGGRVWAVAALLKDGNVLIAGGQGGEDSTGTADLYDSAAASFAPTHGNMSSARSYAAATLLPNGKVLIAGGLDSKGKILASARALYSRLASSGIGQRQPRHHGQ